jgi:hypothetical protein
MLTSLQKSFLVEEAVSFFTDKRVSKMITYSTDEWNLKVWETLVMDEKPPKEEFEAKLQELIDAQPLEELRTKRNTLLAQTDYVATIDYPHATPEKKQEWLDYRQALRDLPTVTEDPANPVWPTAPTS